MMKRARATWLKSASFRQTGPGLLYPQGRDFDRRPEICKNANQGLAGERSQRFAWVNQGEEV
jgi:hypothetical protein